MTSLPGAANGRALNLGGASAAAGSRRPRLLPPGRRITDRAISTGSRKAVRIALILLSYAFLHDNAVSFPGSAGYEWTRLLSLPPQVRFVEVFAIVGLAASLTIERRSITTAWLLGGCVIFSGLSALSYFRHPVVGAVDFARLVYMYLLPILVFVIGRELRWGPSGLQTVVRFVLRWVFISAAVSWFQYLYLGYPSGDDITGLNQDAHVNVSLMIMGSLLLLSEALVTRRWFRIILAIGLGATAVLPSELKVLFLSPFLVVLVLWYYSGGSLWRRAQTMLRRSVVALPLAAVMLVVVFVSFNQFDNLSSARVPALVERALTEPQNFGTVLAYRNGIETLLEGPLPFLLGVGPFGYSNPISMGQSREDGPLGRLTRAELVQAQGESGEDARITLTTSLAVEFGVPAFVVLFSLYALVLVTTHWTAVRSRQETVRRYSAAVMASLVMLVAVAAVALFGSFSSISLSWPIMILAGAASRLEARNLAMARWRGQGRQQLPSGNSPGGD